MAAQERFNRLHIATNMSLMLPVNSELAEIFLKADSPEGLEAAEQTMFNTFWDSGFRYMEWTYRELPTEEFPLLRYKRYFQSPAVRGVWELYKNEFNSGFVAFTDENIL